MTAVDVAIPGHPCKVVVGPGLITKLDQLIGNSTAKRAALITDTAVDSLYGFKVEEALARRFEVQRFVVAEGEASKTIETAGKLIDRLSEGRLRRNDLVVTLGGGVISDLGGFVSSVYLRGLPVVHVPTTLVGQVDAAIGGKTGVNLKAGKNLLGSFHHPMVVVADTSTLQTLPEREFRSGLAEVAKYGFALDAGFLTALEEEAHRLLAAEPAILEDVITKCVEIKASLVGEDPGDQGRRVLLNYGHTLGHALEAYHNYRGLSHGEAISVGMIFAAKLSALAGWLDESQVTRHEKLLHEFGLPTRTTFDGEQVRKLMEGDKKHLEEMRWVVLSETGRSKVESGIEEGLVGRALDYVAA